LKTLAKEGKMMEKKLNRLALAGAIPLMLLVMAGPGWAQFGVQAQQATRVESGNVLCASMGRFVFGQVSESSKDQFMLDTMTGRLWRIAETGEIGLHLRPVPYRDEEGKCTPVPESVTEPKPKGAAKK
jgi:hypothetical protein